MAATNKEEVVLKYDQGPGLVVIFSQNEGRRGNHLDVDRLTETFDKLNGPGFQVKDYQDKSKVEIRELLNKLRDSGEHKDKDYKYLVVVMMAHGGNICYKRENSFGELTEFMDEYFLDCHGERIPMSWIEHFIANDYPRHYHGKPKILIVQACRGQEMNEVTKPEQKRSISSSFNSCPMIVPTSGDFVYIYSTLPNQVSYRDTEKGSWLIQELCDHIEKNPEKDFETLLKAVSVKIPSEKIVKEADGGPNYTQIGLWLSTLSKSFLLGNTKKENTSCWF